MDDTQLRTEFDHFINSNDDYYIDGVHKIMCRIIEHRAAGSSANQQSQVGSVQVTITHLSGNVPSGMRIAIAGNTYDYHSQEASFEANVLVEGQPTEVDKWEIGFVQIVTQGDRRPGVVRFSKICSTLPRFTRQSRNRFSKSCRRRVEA